MPMMPKNVKNILKIAEMQGFTWEFSKGCHIKVRNPEGHLVSTTGGTPSDPRSFKNFRAELRRAGVTGI